MKKGLMAAVLVMSAALPALAAEAGQAQGQAEKADAIAKASGFVLKPADERWVRALPLDANAATQAFMDRIPADVMRKSDAYYEGGYWLQLWHLLLGLAIAAVWMSGRRAARVRDWAARVGRGPIRRDFLFSAAYVGIGSLVSLPLSAYEDFFREHAYGMSTQTASAWLMEWLLANVISGLIAAVALVVLYALIRRARQYWWAWGAAGTIALLTVMIAIAPVVFEPMFNTYKPVEDGPLKQSLLTMARATGVPASDVLVFDASRQTTRISANVTGLFGTAAIRLNDNLLRRTSEAEVRAVTGHEMGHYVLNHIPKMLMMMTLVVLVAFLFAKWALDGLIRRTAGTSGVQDVTDIASMPLLMAVFSVFFALSTPITNTMIRAQEAEADQFSLSLAQEPIGFANAQLRLVEYRKADPGALEEFWFYSHPSTRSRIHAAMQWREAMASRPLPGTP
ncbi:M48 family metallopeptidase [Roseateles terrae]|uniref:STE24 endopeptidase n=1 Tax=Roseateles terrae TaxID=431060 RepID=A0ABR6H0H9_9BURK|nr:M48 family metallopeptidase [Roseateles terrae]MBB3197353.1 STE24 endopeptidase [Roseateles terrae]OWQ83172.1 hypothetical protein CDN98_23260 [Roseateles terrae]